MRIRSHSSLNRCEEPLGAVSIAHCVGLSEACGVVICGPVLPHADDVLWETLGSGDAVYVHVAGTGATGRGALCEGISG
jgi:hypothetical protein